MSSKLSPSAEKRLAEYISLYKNTLIDIASRGGSGEITEDDIEYAVRSVNRDRNRLMSQNSKLARRELYLLVMMFVSLLYIILGLTISLHKSQHSISSLSDLSSIIIYVGVLFSLLFSFILFFYRIRRKKSDSLGMMAILFMKKWGKFEETLRMATEKGDASSLPFIDIAMRFLSNTSNNYSSKETDFRCALNLRNCIAHGDMGRISESELSQGILCLDRLLDSLK